MSQSNYIAAAIAIAFVVYITVKGSLPKYLSILTGSGGFSQDTASAGNPPQQTATAATNSGDTQTAQSGSKQTDQSGSQSSSQTPDKTVSTVTNALSKVGGDASVLLDGVHMFDMAGFLGG